MKRIFMIAMICLFLSFLTACNINIHLDNENFETISSEYSSDTIIETNLTTENTTSPNTFSDNFLEAAYQLVSKNHIVDKEDFKKNADFVIGDYFPSLKLYQIRYNNQVMGYISVNFKDDYFNYSFSTNEYGAEPVSPATLIDGKWFFDESVTLG